MQITQQKIEKLKHARIRISLTVGKDAVYQIYQATVLSYKQKASIKGFRKGTVPDYIIIQQYGAEIEHDALEDTLKQALRIIFKDINEKPLKYDQPQLTQDPKYDAEKELNAVVEYDTFPNFSLPPYTDLVIAFTEHKVSIADIQRELKQIQQDRAILTEKKVDEPIKNSDVVTVDFDETTEDQKTNTRKDFTFIVGVGEQPPFSNAILGMKVGAETHVDNYAITVTKAQTRTLPKLDDAFAKQIHADFNTLNDLKNKIRIELEQLYVERNYQNKRDALIGTIASAVDIDLPQSMINMEIGYTWERMLKQNRVSSEQMEALLKKEGKSVTEVFEQWRPDIEKRIKHTLIIQQLIITEKITATEENVRAYIEQRAKRSGQDVETLQKIYKENNMMQEIISECTEHTLFKHLFEKNRFTVDKKNK